VGRDLGLRTNLKEIDEFNRLRNDSLLGPHRDNLLLSTGSNNGHVNLLALSNSLLALINEFLVVGELQVLLEAAVSLEHGAGAVSLNPDGLKLGLADDGDHDVGGGGSSVLVLLVSEEVDA
jgi:hypothetical protein